MYFSSQNICNLVSVIPTLGQSFQGWLWFPGGQCHYQFFCTGLPDPCAIVSDFTIPSETSLSFITFLLRPSPCLCDAPPQTLVWGSGYMQMQEATNSKPVSSARRLHLLLCRLLRFVAAPGSSYMRCLRQWLISQWEEYNSSVFVLCVTV